MQLLIQENNNMDRFLLRDKEFDNLDQICFAFSKDRIELEQRLAKAGYHYDAQDKRFW